MKSKSKKVESQSLKTLRAELRGRQFTHEQKTTHTFTNNIRDGARADRSEGNANEDP